MMNSVSIIGRLTKDVELRYTPAGKAVATGTLAVNRPFKNAQGENEADFIQFVIWGKVAETVANRTEKGGRVGGVGRIQTRNYENQSGQRVYVTEVVIDNVTMIDWAGEGNGQGGQGSYGQNQNQNQGRGRSNGTPPPGHDDPFANDGQPMDISDDDLPF